VSQQTGQSVGSDIIDAVVDVLGVGAYRCRFKPFARAELPAMNVIPEDNEAQYQNTGDIERRDRFHVRYTAAEIEGADLAADRLYVTGTKRLMADRTLGGAVKIVREIGAKWEREQAEVQIIALVVTYEVEYSTSTTDPSVPGY
jgi:hypothetical protein